MTEWVEHDGSGMPVPGETLVVVKFRDGHVSETWDAEFWNDSQGGCWTFSKNSPNCDIVAYRIST